MAKIRTVAVLPTLFTLANLVCGFFAIVVAARVDAPTSIEVPSASPLARSPMKAVRALDPADPTHNVMLSGWLIFLAMLFDALDGHIARLSNWTSNFGGQLDSLSDLVTFGVAPAFLLVKMCPRFAYLHHDWAWIIAASYVVCAALRLARFTIETDEDDDHLHFSGLPSPAAAASIAGFAILFYTLRRDDTSLMYADKIDAVLQTVLPFFAALVALLMVSRIPYPHVVNQVFSGQRSLGHIVGLVFALVAIMVIRGYAVPLVCVGFVALGPIHYLWQEYVQRQPHKDPLF
ncbi:MAG: CDP-diacylglycerol--serine O-phosphatidyltransferase [Planctomycetia bacterium]|nr:CDP-diacylglycerol--serine O-phosphatidyltransferase [Planctomycetia bacterium]